MSRWLSWPLFLSFVCVGMQAETFTMTLQQAVGRALQESPDIALARIDEQKAALNVRVVKDPFSAKVGMGSGIAYTNGFPLSIDGSGPSIVQARASQYIFNKPQSYLVAQARENARGAAFAAGSKTDALL